MRHRRARRRTPRVPPASGQGRGGGDEAAIERYRYLLRTAPPEAIEQAHAEAFATLTPEQRRTVLTELGSQVPAAERAASDDPKALARMAHAPRCVSPACWSARSPAGAGWVAAMAWHMGMGGGMGMGGMLAGGLFASMAGAFVGTAIANEIFDDDHGNDAGDNDNDNSNDNDNNDGNDSGNDGSGNDRGGNQSDVQAAGDYGNGDYGNGDYGTGDDGGGGYGGGTGAGTPSADSVAGTTAAVTSVVVTSAAVSTPEPTCGRGTGASSGSPGEAAGPPASPWTPATPGGEAQDQRGLGPTCVVDRWNATHSLPENTPFDVSVPLLDEQHAESGVGPDGRGQA